MNRLEAAIRSPKKAGRPALMPYLTAGYPSREGFPDLLLRVAEVADAVELGVPFSDPMADGVTIQASSRAALDGGVTLEWILQMLQTIEPAAPIVLMSYLNPLLQYGYERLVADAAAAGVSGFIVPDLPYEECDELRALAEGAGLSLVQLVTPVTPTDRLRRLCASSGGFVYAVTITGITGASALPSNLAQYLDKVRSVSEVPVCAGFGIRTASDVAALTGHADGAVVGSALIDVIGKGGDAVGFLEGLVS